MFSLVTLLTQQFVYINERSINVMAKPFDWIKVPPLCVEAQNFVHKIAWSTHVPGYKPNGEDRGSYSRAPAEKKKIKKWQKH